MHIQGPRESRRGGWQLLDTGSLYGYRAMHTDQRSQAWCSRITTSATYVLPHVLLRGCVARICGETYMISSEVQQDLLGCIRYGHG